MIANGTRLGPYEIVEPLGAGGMGEVYRARDTRLERTVAIKILPVQFCTDPVRKQRFQREAKTISSLNHPHICTLHDVGSHDGVDYLVMECVEGETLEKRLEKGPLSLEQALKVGAQIADALWKAHRAGIVHRDLKPGNIMLTGSGAKLLDFGLAKEATPLVSLATVTVAKAATPVTQEGMIVGTFQYMSPEQVEGKELDGRSDIFSLGAVLYEMVTGRRAFEGKSQLSVASAILEREPPAMRTVKPVTPAALEHAVMKCIAKDPEERWQTGKDLGSELQWMAEAGTATASGESGSLVQKRRRFLVPIAVGIAAIFAGIVLARFFQEPSHQPKIYSSINPPEGEVFSQNASEWAATIVSPDGKKILVGLNSGKGRDRLYVRSLDAPSGQILDGTDGATFPFWSPDSQLVGFFADGQLKTMPATGGPVHIVCPAPQGRGGAWSPNGTIVFSPTPAGGLSRVDAKLGNAVALTKLDTSRHEDSHRWPQFLPDGRHFLFLSRTADRINSEVRVGSIDSPEQTTVLRLDGNAVYSPPGYLLCARDSNLVAQKFDPVRMKLEGESTTIAEQVAGNGFIDFSDFSVSSNGVLAYARGATYTNSTLMWRDRSGAHLGDVGAPDFYYGISLSPDRTKLAVEIRDSRGNGNSDIWVFELRTGAKTRLTFSNPGEHNSLPVWSPDGKRIIFSSDRGGFTQVYEKVVDGTEKEELIPLGGGHHFATTWSPDGKYVAGIQQNAAVAGTTFLVFSLLDRRPVDFLPGAIGVSRFAFPRISPNGKWIAYVTFETGRAELYLSTFPGGSGKWQVSMNGGNDPHWRSDSKELYFNSLDENLMVATIDDNSGAPQVGKVEALFHFHRVASPNWVFDASQDGSRFLTNSPVMPNVPEPITLVVNWDAELRK